MWQAPGRAPLGPGGERRGVGTLAQGGSGSEARGRLGRRPGGRKLSGVEGEQAEGALQHLRERRLGIGRCERLDPRRRIGPVAEKA